MVSNIKELKHDYVYTRVFANRDICKEFLDIVIGEDVGCIKYNEAQKSISNKMGRIGIRLDTLVEVDGWSYNIEMQVANHHDLAIRSFDYLANMWGDLIHKKKEKYTRGICSIFICMFDPLGFGDSMYVYNSVGLTRKDILDDKVCRIFLNAKDYSKEKNPKLKSFLRYVYTSEVSDEFTEKIDVMVKKINDERKDVVSLKLNYLLREERFEGEKLGIEKGEKLGIEKGEKLGIEKGEKLGIEKGEKLGIEKGEKLGIAKANIEMTKKLFDFMGDEEISGITGLSVEHVSELREVDTNNMLLN